ncbi:MAG: DUF2786 domain-containing protein [Acidimicrobiales bacterium]
MLGEAATELRRALPLTWEAGWQPAELVRQARRTGARVGRLLASAVLADHAHRHAATLHPRWAEQVDELACADRAAGAAAGLDAWLAAFTDREGLTGEELASAVVDGLAVCLGVRALPVIIPPPGSGTAPSGGADRSRSHAANDDPVLAKVRALLAQAESTTYEAEAATFTEKAQELMARHAIELALVWEQAGRDERPVTVRLAIDDPYIGAKSLLLQVVAIHSRCRSVFHELYALSSVVGFASDVSTTEVLFTSLLVQSQVAMRSEGRTAGPGSRVRSRSFRSSFLFAYVGRIDERLAAVNASVEAEADATQGSSLLPVLVARSDAVDDRVEELFGPLRGTHVRTVTDPVGWARGRMAADRAELSFGDLDVNVDVEHQGGRKGLGAA